MQRKRNCEKSRALCKNPNRRRAIKISNIRKWLSDEVINLYISISVMYENLCKRLRVSRSLSPAIVLRSINHVLFMRINVLHGNISLCSFFRLQSNAEHASACLHFRICALKTWHRKVIMQWTESPTTCT